MGKRKLGSISAATSATRVSGLRTFSKLPRPLAPSKSAIPFRPFPRGTLSFPENYSEGNYTGPNPLAANANFRVLSENGISTTRPDILALTQFQPAYYDLNEPIGAATRGAPASELIEAAQNVSELTFGAGGNLTPVGKMLQVQVWAQRLLVNKMIELVAVLKSYPELQDQIEERENFFQQQIELAGADADLLFSLISRIDRLREAFNIRQSLARADRRRESAGRGGIGIFGKMSKGPQLAPSSILQEELGFDAKNVEVYTNTKLLQQTVFDLRRIINRHSYNLFNGTVPERKSDLNPTNINREVDSDASTFQFRPEALQSGFGLGAVTDATSPDFHRRFLDSLPDREDDRIRLLLTTLSKVFRVSAGLGNPDVLSVIGRSYPNVINTGDPFPTILGTIGQTITDRVQGPPRSLAALTQLSPTGLNTESFVLPFEDVYLSDTSNGLQGADTTSPEGTLYIPGTAFFLDPIVDSDTGGLDTSALDNFLRLMNSGVGAARHALGQLLQLVELSPDPGDNFDDIIGLDGMVQELVSLLSDSLDSIKPVAVATSDFTDDEAGPNFFESTELNFNHVLIAALAEEAQKDREIKNDLFRLFMLSGVIQAQTTTAPSPGQFFVDIAGSNELGVGANGAPAERGVVIDRIVRNVVRNYTRPTFTQGRNIILTQQGEGGVVQPLNSLSSAFINDRFFEDTITESQLRNVLLDLSSRTSVNQSRFQGTWFSFLFDQIERFDSILRQRSAVANRRTRYQGLSGSTWALLWFEAVVSAMARYTPANFARGEGGSTIRVVLNSTRQEKMSRIISAVASSTGDTATSLNSLIKFDAFEQSRSAEVRSLVRSIREEDDSVIRIMRMWSQINTSLQSQGRALRNYFSPTSPNVQRLREIQLLIGGNSANSQLVYDRPQAALAQSLVADVEERLSRRLGASQSIDPLRGRRGFDSRSRIGGAGNANTVKEPNDALFIDEDIPEPGSINALFEMLKQPIFKGETGRDTRILTVGIPAGFTSNLRRQIDVNKVSGDTFNTKAKDIIAIDVYKRDEQYDGLVFKPKTYLFELSRFVSRGADHPIDGSLTTFDQVVDSMLVNDFSTDQTLSNEQGSGFRSSVGSLLNNPDYDFLSEPEVRSLQRNHVQTFLLELYIRLITGLTTNEKVFTSIPDVLRDRADQAAFLREAATVQMSRTAGRPIDPDTAAGGDIFSADTVVLQACDNFDAAQQLIDAEGISKPLKTKMTEDLKTFARLFNSRTTLSDGRLERARLISPKLYERTFNITVNPNAFEIDIANSDRASVEYLTQVGMIEERTVLQPGASADPTDPTNNIKTLKLRRRSPENGHVSFEKYFVTVRTIDTSTAKRQVPPPPDGSSGVANINTTESPQLQNVNTGFAAQQVNLISGGS